MKIKVDREADALYLGLSDTTVVDSIEVSPGIIIDNDVEGRMVGIEVLHISKRSPDLNISNFVYETVPDSRTGRS